MALVRLTLGECYLAAGDTARGRVVLDNLGRDPEFRQAAGHAHYHLARLDLAQGHFGMARDRFAVVALDNPGAPYANDALDLGLAIAEEMENPSGGPSILALYAASVYFDLTAQPDRAPGGPGRFRRPGRRPGRSGGTPAPAGKGPVRTGGALPGVRPDRAGPGTAWIWSSPNTRMAAIPARALEMRGRILQRVRAARRPRATPGSACWPSIPNISSSMTSATN